nr:proteasome activator subunit 4 [Tanacetum cinerariifolium]
AVNQRDIQRIAGLITMADILKMPDLRKETYNILVEGDDHDPIRGTCKMVNLKGKIWTSTKGLTGEHDPQLLTFLRSFMYRHAFVRSNDGGEKIWEDVQKLLIDNQVQVKDHAAAILTGLIKGEDGELSKGFRK